MKHIHFIGIGGTGLSAIAKVLLEQGYQVSGSDLTASELFDAVEAAGGIVYRGHQAEHIQGADLVVRSSAVPEQNPEVQAALAAGIPVLKRSEFLGQVLQDKQVIAVAGSHGKTTTSSMLSWILADLGLDPSFIVGGVVANLGTNARAGQGKLFVIEADEYDYMFLGLDPDLALVTNVEHDHPDIFPTPETFAGAFEKFVSRLRPGGSLILCGEDPGAMALAGRLKQDQSLLVYGFEGKGKDYIARDILSLPNGGSEFALEVAESGRNQILDITLGIPGKHNVLNAAGVMAAADRLGLDLETAASALARFQGSERRFEIRGEFQGITLVDDYGHHPTEIKATLAAARSAFPGHRLLAVWQPHTYSRTQTLFSGFVEAFADADEIIVLEVFAAREAKPKDFSLTELVDAIPGGNALYIPGIDQAVGHLKAELQPGDVLLVFSAGDAVEINRKLKSYLSGQA